MSSSKAGHPAASHGLPRLIAWEVTRHCLLACKHCRAAAQSTPDPGELTTDECFRLLDNIASFAKPIIILTGGEPMLRPDVYDIAARASSLGLSVAMAPCGVLINDETAARMVQSGVKRISLSLDGVTAQSHDGFRGVDGAFDACLRGIEAAKRAGLDFQVNTTVSKHNLAELHAILDLAVRLGASVFNPFLLVPTGRGKNLADQELTSQQYEQTLQWLAERQNHPDIQIRVTCAPHYQRIVRQLPARSSSDRSPAGCMGGKSFAFISHRGKVQICGFLDVECGDVRRENYNFRKIWDTSDVFLRVRDVNSYGGRCGYCEFRKVCGGCRARAYALTGDFLAEEPYCIYQPKGHVADPTSEAPPELDELDKKLLSLIQTELPVSERPFDVLAERLGTHAQEIIARVARLHREGVIRRLGPVFDSRALGYVSTLVAACIAPNQLDTVASLVSELPGVTHNYRREHAYNLWFTLTAASSDSLARVIENLREQTGIDEFYSLPALMVYKTRVNFHLSDELPPPDAISANAPAPTVRLDDNQKALVRLLQEGLPVVGEPFADVAAELGWSTQRVLARISDWLAQGVIRRFGAVVNHRRLGFKANGMAVFEVASDRVDEVGRRLADYPQVSHCYRRKPLPDWNYNLFAMVHGQSFDEVARFVADVVRELKFANYEVLFSSTEYKKTSMRYYVSP